MQQSESSWFWSPDTAIRHGSAGRIIGGKAAGLHKRTQAGKWERERGGQAHALSLLPSGNNSHELNGNTSSYVMDYFAP